MGRYRVTGYQERQIEGRALTLPSRWEAGCGLDMLLSPSSSLPPDLLAWVFTDGGFVVFLLLSLWFSSHPGGSWVWVTAASRCAQAEKLEQGKRCDAGLPYEGRQCRMLLGMPQRWLQDAKHSAWPSDLCLVAVVGWFLIESCLFGTRINSQPLRLRFLLHIHQGKRWQLTGYRPSSEPGV